MKRSKICLIIITVTIFSLLFSACSGDKNTEVENVVNPIGNDSNSNVVVAMGNNASRWDDNIPKEFIEFKYGDAISMVKDKSTWGLVYYNVTEEEIKEYTDKYIQAGWLEDHEMREYEKYLFTNGSFEAFIVIGETEEDGTHFVSLYLDEEADTFESDEDENGNGGLSEYNLDDTEAKIPENYPNEFVPIYTSSSVEIIGGDYQLGGTVDMFFVIIGAQEDYDTVNKAIMAAITKKVPEDKINDFSAMGSMMIMGKSGEWDFTITSQDGSADGYLNLITYTVTN